MQLAFYMQSRALHTAEIKAYKQLDLDNFCRDSMLLTRPILLLLLIYKEIDSYSYAALK